MNNKWLTKLIIFVFLLSTFSNSALVVTPAFAETGGDAVTEVAYEKGIHKLPIKLLDEKEDKTLDINDNVKANEAEVEVSSSGLQAYITLTNADKIESFKVEENGKLVEAEEVFKNEDENTEYIKFNLDNVTEPIKGEVEVVTEDGTETVATRIVLDATKIPLVEVESNNDSQENTISTFSADTSDNSEENSGENDGDKSSNGGDNAEETPEEQDGKNSEENGTDEEDETEKEEEQEEKEPTPTGKLEDGAYELSYTTKGANIGSFYEDKATVIVDGDKQFLQLQGTKMREYIEYLYINGKRMEVGEETNEAGAYIAQIELGKKVENIEALSFVMVINARGNIMSHATDITLKFDEMKELDKYELIEGIPAKENTTFVKSDDSIAYGYNSEVDLSRYYEDTINVVQKDGQQYIEFKGPSMANFIEALYVDGKKMAIKKDDDNSYVAQVAHDKEVTEKFNFTMIINAMGRIMMHSTDVALNVPDTAHIVSYTTDGANISRNFKPEAILLEKDGKEYIQLQGTSMRQFIEYLYINGEKIDISGAINKGGAYLAQFELPKPLKELSEKENEFTFDMVINAAGSIMQHTTTVSFKQDSMKEVTNTNHTLITDTTTKNKSTIVESENTKQVAYKTEGANISRNYEDKITIVEKDGKQYLQLHGTSMQQFVDALFIDGKRMNIGEAGEGGSYLAQYELPTSLAANNTYNFVMLINARGNIMMHSTKLIIDSDGEYSIDYDVLYEDEDKTSTASAYLVQPTKLEVADGKYKLFVKLTDHETIKEFDVKQGEDYVPAEVVKTDAGANTRIVAFEIDNLKDAIHAQVKVDIPGNYTSTQPFRIVLKPDTIGAYDGELEKEEEPLEFGDGYYTINFRTLDAENFEKVAVGNLLNPPAHIELKDDKRTVTLTIDDAVESFEIEQEKGKFVAPKVVGEDKDAGTRDVQFDITEHNEIVLAKMMVTNEKLRSAATEHKVRLYFEGNSMKPAEKEEVPAEKVELVAEKASNIKYKILKENNDGTSLADSYFSGEAVILEYNGKKYAQITTQNESAAYITWLKNKIDGSLQDMVIVDETNGDRTYQFMLDKTLTEKVFINMFINVPGIYDAEHDALLKFNESSLKEANPEDYTLVASTNDNGPDGDDAQTPGEDNETPGKDEDNETPGKDNPTADEDPIKDVPTKGKALTADKVSEVPYKVLKEDSDEVSETNNRLSGKAIVLEYEGDTYVQIETKENNAQYIKWFQSKYSGYFVNMLVVGERNGEKIYQFKLDDSLENTDEVALKMFIEVAGIYAKEHGGRLVFDAEKATTLNAQYYPLFASSNISGPGDVEPTEPSEPTDPKDPVPPPSEAKEKEAYSINYTILQANQNEVSIANQYFSGKATLIDYDENTYVQISTKDASGDYITWLKNKLDGEYKDMLVVKDKNGDKTYQFKFNKPLSEFVELDMFIDVPKIYEARHKARLAFSTPTLEEMDAKKATLYNDKDGIQGPKKGGEPVDLGGGQDDEKDKNNGNGKTTGSNNQGPASNGQGTTKEEGTSVKPEKAFAINYVIKQENADEVSIANDYFTGQAILLEKGKDKYAHITTKNGSAKFIDALRSQLNGKFVDMSIVSKDGDDITYQFKLDGAVSEATLLDMVITVPGIYENQAHKARLFFDENSMEEIDPAGHEIVGLSKPSFGEGSNGTSGKKSGQETNPKTNDVTMIVFYSLLLVGAGLVLFFQFRRKFAKQ